MGFWSSIFGHAAVHAYKDVQKKNKEIEKWNDLHFELSNYSSNFNDYLKSIGSSEFYVFDVTHVNNGNITPAKQEIDRLRKKVETFISLGGKGTSLYSLDDLDDGIELLKYLNEKKCVDRYDEFCVLWKPYAMEVLEKEEQEKIRKAQTEVTNKTKTKNFYREKLYEFSETALLLNAAGNEINDIIDENLNENLSPNALQISYVSIISQAEAARLLKINDTDMDSEYPCTVIVLDNDKLRIYDLITNNLLMYRGNITTSPDKDFEYTPFCFDKSMSIVRYKDIYFQMSTADAKLFDNKLYESKVSPYTLNNINSLSGIEFENLCQQLVEKMGFETQTTKVSGDGGIDLIAYNRQPLLSGKYIIQCKRYTGGVGEPIIRDLYGVVTSERANKGILMTTGHFTKSAIMFADGKPLELIDGGKLNDLLKVYGFLDETGSNDELSIEEVFEDNFMISDEYDYYINTINDLEKTNDEKERAKFINKLLDYTMSEFCDVSDFNHKLVFFKEIKRQILKYVNGNRIEKSRYLAYLYQMIYIQLSILEGNFKEAETMFYKLQENRELKFTVSESMEPEHTKALFGKHVPIFSCLFYTYYDLVQMGIAIGNEDLVFNLINKTDYYGLTSLSESRLHDTIAHYELHAPSKAGYWKGELEALQNIESLHCMYFMSNYEPSMYYKFTYENGNVQDISLDRHMLSLTGNKLVIDGIGEIEKLRQKIDKYNN